MYVFLMDRGQLVHLDPSLWTQKCTGMPQLYELHYQSTTALSVSSRRLPLSVPRLYDGFSNVGIRGPALHVTLNCLPSQKRRPRCSTQESQALVRIVSNLRDLLAEKKIGIPLDRQILLASGGFLLEAGHKISDYGAGLDQTNPIYVFTRTSPDDDAYQTPDVLEVNDGGFPQRLERLLSAQPSLGALNDRLCLVDPLAPIAQQTCMAIEQLVSEQRQMIQGWCVALANLAEVTARAEKCLTVDAARLSTFETRAGDWEEKLNLVADLKRELSQVPLLPQLIYVLTDSWTQGQRTTGTASRTPSNLYDWVCLQITLSARTSRIPQTLHSNALQVTMGSSPLSTVSRPRVIPGGRPRRTSAGNLEHSSLAGLIPGSPKNDPNALHQMRGSQPSLGNLFAPCSPSPSLQQLSVNQDPQSDSIDEHDFLLVIESAKHDLNILLNGDESSSYAAYRASGDMPYTRYLTTRYSELLSLVPSCTAVSPTGVDSHTSGNSNEKDARSSPPESSPVARVEFLDPETVALTRESLSGTDFSLLLARLEPVTEVAIQLFDRIQTVQRSTTAFYQRAMKTRDMSAITEQFPTHTSQLQELLNAFRQLCRILAETMESKLDLAENLHKRQCWLQNFQSYMHRVDASIQKCLSRMGRVARTTTLISQLQKAPEVYTRCLVEVVRQHEFETNYAQIIREQRISRSEEVTRRTKFAKLLTDNILHSLFAPWTSSRGDRSNLSKNIYHGSTRNLNTPDSTENDPTTGRPDLRTPGKSAHDSQQWTRSQALGSRSEPRLNEMIGASSLVRTGSRGRPKETLRSMARKLVEVEEDENEHRSPESRISLGKTRVSTDAMVKQREQTGMQRKGDSGSRRISMPAGEPEPASPVWTLGENEEEVPVFMDQAQQSFCVTRDDLEHLSAVLPSHLAEILHQELTRVLMPVNQTFLGCQSSSHELAIQPPVVRHVGLSPLEQSASIDAVTTDSHHSGDQEGANWETVDAACQTDFPSPVRRWDVHSQSASLLIPGFGSPQRPHLTGWDPLPSSLCSWEFCPPNPPSRLGLLKRSASTNGLLEFTSTTAVKRTQTEDSATNTDDRVPPPDNPESADVEPVFLESLVSHPDDSPQENQPPETAPSPCSLPEDFASLVLESIPTDDLYVDPEFATPTALMSSSFHSTQTNFSNAEESTEPPRDQLDKCLDELGATPTQAVGTVVETPSFPSDSGGWSTPASLVNPQTCSCQLNKLHAACTDLLELFSSNPSILETMSSSSGDDVGLLKQILARFVNSSAGPVCAFHPRTRETSTVQSDTSPTTTISPGESRAVPTESVGVQVDRSVGRADCGTCTTPLGTISSIEQSLSSILPTHQILPTLPALTDVIPTALSDSTYPLANPLALSSVKVLQRFLKFTHSNFVHNDTVVFVPIRGSTHYTSPSKRRSSGEPEPGSSPPSTGVLKAINPTSSMLSSTIIQSMDISSSTTTAHCLSRTRDFMYTSTTPATTTGSGKTKSSLFKELFSSTVGDLLASSFYPPGEHRADGPVQANPSKSSKSVSSEAAVTQWRMLSSDGHVYFLHQDDFAALNLDPQTDYCKPFGNPARTQSVGRSRQPGCLDVAYTSQHQPRQHGEQDATMQSGAEPRSYFVVASYQRKERCLSKRKDNRFNLPKNFAFYRVRAKPLQIPAGLEQTLTTS